MVKAKGTRRFTYSNNAVKISSLKYDSIEKALIFPKIRIITFYWKKKERMFELSYPVDALFSLKCGLAENVFLNIFYSF